MLKPLLHSSLKFLAALILKKYRPDVVGITGSVGKTAAKEAVALVLGSQFRVRASYKNYNTLMGAMLTIIGITEVPGRSVLRWISVLFKALQQIVAKNSAYPEILVLEMGADKPGDIQNLVSLAPCKVGVLTYISHAHTEAFKTIKKIAQEKRVILSSLQTDGYAILNYDNDLVMENASVTQAEKITYGLKNGADMLGSDARILFDDAGKPVGLNFKVNFKGSIVPIFLPGIIGSSCIPAALVGLAVGHVFGINLVDAGAALQKLTPLPGRMRMLDGIKKTLIIDDTYNSSPAAAKLALDTLARLPVVDRGERYAVLGDMLELGTETEGAHREVGFAVAEKGIDYLITVGEAAKGLAKAAQEAGLDTHRIACFDTAEAAGKFLQEKLKSGDVALVKGSQAMRMEKIVKEVMALPLRAKELLVRQDESWK